MSKIQQIWDNILTEIEGEISALPFDLWIKTLSPVCIYKDRLVLLANTEATKNITEKRYRSTIKKVMQKVFPSLSDVEIITEEEKQAFDQYVESDNDLPINESIAPDEELEQTDRFVESYTFDNFVVGKSNEFANAAARAVAEKPGSKYNPLFLYGGVGLGKTHLMHAIGNYHKQNLKYIKCIYISSERFTNELIEALSDSKKRDSMKNFRKKYRDADVLMIDDIQFIARTVATQEEIFHTFNDLYLAGKQIIISSDRPPKEIAPLEERLRTRFECGLVADISQPDLEMRIAILEKMCNAEGVYMDRNILREIAEKVTSNIRDLKGLLTRVIFFANLTGKDCNDAEMVKNALKDYADDKNEVITMVKITNCVAEYFNISTEEIKGKKKTKEIVLPRQISIYLITELLTIPLINIGEFFGGKDHTTIMHARDKISASMRENSLLATQVKDIKDMILKK